MVVYVIGLIGAVLVGAVGTIHNHVCPIGKRWQSVVWMVGAGMMCAGWVGQLIVVMIS